MVFDMDGVLMDSSAIHDAAFREALRGYSVPDFRYSSVAGMRTNEALRTILGSVGAVYTEAQIATLSMLKSEVARAAIRELNPIAPECLPVLTALASDYRLALASSASRKTVEVFLGQNDLAGFFEVVLSGDDVANAKPDPLIYGTCCKQLNLDPHECLVIEDAESGVRAAKSAGTFVLGLTTPEGEQALKLAGADLVVHSLHDVLFLRRSS